MAAVTMRQFNHKLYTDWAYDQAQCYCYACVALVSGVAHDATSPVPGYGEHSLHPLRIVQWLSRRREVVFTKVRN